MRLIRELNSRKKFWHVVGIISALIFSIGHYYDARNATVNHTSSDLWNILPSCIKLDHPELYKDDLFLNKASNVAYYTPAFLNSIRFFAGASSGNYVEGLNKLNFLINLVYALSWFIFFLLITRDGVTSLIMSVLARSIMWLPGHELWGAGALWTALPRTAYLALLPIALVAFLPNNTNRIWKYLGALFAGLIGNLHPISGLGVCMGLLGSEGIYHLHYNKRPLGDVLLQLLFLGILMLVGLGPFIFNYTTNVLAVKPTDPELFNQMIPLRIGEAFFNPFVALEKFTELKWLAFILLPMVATLFIPANKNPGDTLRYYYLFAVVVLIGSIAAVPAENMLRKAGIADVHMSFQLIRNIKYLMVTVLVCWAAILHFLIGVLSERFHPTVRWGVLGLFLLALLFSRLAPFNRLPFIGDDVIRATLPNVISLKPEVLNPNSNLDEAFNWINKNTPASATFIAPPQLRTACRRSVVYDHKGASMLIEGNPDAFVEWGRKRMKLKACGENITCKLELYQQWGAEYILTDEMIKDTILVELNSSEVNRFGKWRLYRFN